MIRPIEVRAPAHRRRDRNSPRGAVGDVSDESAGQWDRRIRYTSLGQVRSGEVVMATGGGRSQSAAVVTGIAAPAGPRFATGTLEGVITFDGAGCSNNAHRWDLDQPLPFRNQLTVG